MNISTDMPRLKGYRYQMADMRATFPLRNRDRDRRLMDIKPDERATLHVVSPPFLRLGTRQPGAALERRMPRERPPVQSGLQRDHGV